MHGRFSAVVIKGSFRLLWSSFKLTVILTPPPGVFHQRLEPQKPTSFSIFTL
jgi:hypothetical protein